jgi:thiamine-phosphate pyrophosphorylase
MAAFSGAGMHSKFPPLYPILDASFLPSENRAGFLTRLISELADAGVTLLQYRNKQGGDSEVLADAAVMRQAAAHAVRLIMNDSPELAVRAGFDGVHVGQEDLSPVEARRIAGPERIVGVSTHNRAQLERAAAQPVDYIAIGPVFATASKENPDPVVGLEGVREARRLTTKPLVAIGGITLENAGQVLEAGADSVAVISALFGLGKDSAKIAKDFLLIFR